MSNDEDHPWVRGSKPIRRDEIPAKPQYKVFKEGALSKSKWVSRQAPGTPVAYETMFEAIKSNKYDTKAFTYAQRIHKIDDALLFSAYEYWCRGEIHPHILKQIQGEESDKI